MAVIGRRSSGNEEAQITYGELNQKAGQLAHVLREKGIGPDTIVAIRVERSVEMIAGIFGILKAGGAYLPIAADYPHERIEFMLNDSSASLLLTAEEITESLHAARAGQPVSLPITPKLSSANLAYIIYTSGSTGRPKGVMIQHRSVINRLNWMQKTYPISGRDIIMQKTPYGFDVSVWELFWWSFRGAAVCLPAPGEEKDPAAIIEIIRRCGVTTMHFVPSMLGSFLGYVDSGVDVGGLNCLRRVFASGEELTPHYVKQFNSSIGEKTGTKLINLYGPTEATVDVSYFDCPAAGTPEKIPIGKPIDNTGLYVVDKYLKLQPAGVPGELLISGEGLARGYLNRPELTAARFVNPFGSLVNGKISDDRFYKTGDLAKWLPDGNIEFLGRIDHQVKIRGVRIELGEIEHRLLDHPGIKEAVVICEDNNNGVNALYAYIVSDFELTAVELREYLSAFLPGYMIPSQFFRVEKIPLTPNGKIDREAMSSVKEIMKTGVEYAPPVGEVEEKITGVWKEILGLEDIGVNDNFFELGGNSLQIITISNKMKVILGNDIPVVKIFSYPTIRALANYLSKNEPDDITPDEKMNESFIQMKATMQLLSGEQYG
jgi:amino acid adenylation domain-containing protein